MKVVVHTITNAEPVAAALERTGRCSACVADTEEEFETLIGDADGLVIGNSRLDARRSAVERNAGHLKWLQFSSSGYDALERTSLPASIVVTRAVGVWAPTVAEHALAMTLALLRGLFPLGTGYAVPTHLRVVAGLRTLVVGYGEVGRAYGRLVSGLGAHLTAVARSARLEDGLQVHPIDALGELLGHAELVVVTAPEQSGRRPILDAAALAQLPPGAFLINVGRGSTVDEDALAEALRTRRLAGAALDVFAHEPLPPGSPLRSLRNLILTPHSAGRGDPSAVERLARLCATNAIRVLDGRAPEGLLRVLPTEE